MNVINPETTINILRSSPDKFRQIIESMPTNALTWSDGGWSIAAVITHLAINEVYLGQRLHHIASEDDPVLVSFRSDEMIPITGNPTSTTAGMLARWQADRIQLCDWLAGLSPDDWSRRATHPERGVVTFAQQVRLLIDHDAEHLEQANAVRRAWETRQQRR